MAELDLTKPLVDGEGHEYTLIASNVIEDIPGITETRIPGQTLLAQRVHDDRLFYFFSDGVYDFRSLQGSKRDLRNKPPAPVVVKSKRAVSVDCDGVVRATGRSGTYPNEVEFTTTNGVLTGVEIIKANTNVEDC